jgi:hypothetical protein
MTRILLHAAGHSEPLENQRLPIAVRAGKLSQRQKAAAGRLPIEPRGKIILVRIKSASWIFSKGFPKERNDSF